MSMQEVIIIAHILIINICLLRRRTEIRTSISRMKDVRGTVLRRKSKSLILNAKVIIMITISITTNIINTAKIIASITTNTTNTTTITMSISNPVAIIIRLILNMLTPMMVLVHTTIQSINQVNTSATRNLHAQWQQFFATAMTASLRMSR